MKYVKRSIAFLRILIGLGIHGKMHKGHACVNMKNYKKKKDIRELKILEHLDKVIGSGN
jgi:hypothetical protein